MALFSVTVRPYADKRRPNLKFVLRVRRPDRRIERFFYESEKKATAEAAAKKQEIANLGVHALRLDHGQLVDAMTALERLAPHGATLTNAADCFLASLEISTATVAEICERYIDTREKLGLSSKYLRGLRSTLNRFSDALGTNKAGETTPEVIETWLHGLEVSPISINSYRRILHAVFQHAADRKRIKENPVAQVELVKETPGKVGILTVAQMTVLLASAKDPDVLATVAIGGFAGLRPEEIARLRWSAINLAHGQIDCDADITKTAKSRYVKIEPVLAAWLQHSCAALVGTDDLVQGPNFQRRWNEVRWGAGFHTPGNHVLKPNNSGQESASPDEIAAVAAAKIPWPHDALRHSYASYHIAKYQDAAALALQLGHTTTKLIFSSYRHRVKMSDAEAWWSAFPLRFSNEDDLN